MGELSAAEFADWLHPSDVIEAYHQRRELDPRSLVASMLADGLLRAAARQLILNGRDHGLALIPRQVWSFAAKTEVWSTGRFQITHLGSETTISVSAYDVRIDREIRDALKPTPAAKDEIKQSSKGPLSDALLTKWGEAFRAANPDATEAMARFAVEATFPSKFVSRERLRRIMPPRRRGRPLKDND